MEVIKIFKQYINFGDLSYFQNKISNYVLMNTLVCMTLFLLMIMLLLHISRINITYCLVCGFLKHLEDFSANRPLDNVKTIDISTKMWAAKHGWSKWNNRKDWSTTNSKPSASNQPPYHRVMLLWGSDSFTSPTYGNDVSYLLESPNFLFLHLSNRQIYLFPTKCLCMVTPVFASFNSQSFQASFGSPPFIETALAKVTIDLLATKSKSLLHLSADDHVPPLFFNFFLGFHDIMLSGLPPVSLATPQPPLWVSITK